MVGTGPTESLGHVPSQTTEEAHAASSVGGASDTGGESTTVDDSEDLNYFDAHFMLHTDELCKY